MKIRCCATGCSSEMDLVSVSGGKERRLELAKAGFWSFLNGGNGFSTMYVCGEHYARTKVAIKVLVETFGAKIAKNMSLYAIIVDVEAEIEAG